MVHEVGVAEVVNRTQVTLWFMYVFIVLTILLFLLLFITYTYKILYRIILHRIHDDTYNNLINSSML